MGFLGFLGIFRDFCDFLRFLGFFGIFLGLFGKVYEFFSSDLPLVENNKNSTKRLCKDPFLEISKSNISALGNGWVRKSGGFFQDHRRYL